jgi:hypothetical protein
MNWKSKYLLLILVGFFPQSAVAADPLCKEIRSAQKRASCECRSDLGATVRRRPDGSGKLIVDVDRLGRNRLPELTKCMEGKGYSRSVS